MRWRGWQRGNGSHTLLHPTLSGVEGRKLGPTSVTLSAENTSYLTSIFADAKHDRLTLSNFLVICNRWLSVRRFHYTNILTGNHPT
jgi:hypothetical protein